MRSRTYKSRSKTIEKKQRESVRLALQQFYLPGAPEEAHSETVIIPTSPKKRPKSPSLCPTEAAEQRAFFKLAAYRYPQYYPYLFAIPNGGSRDPIGAYQLKLQGVKRGVSDIYLAYPVLPYHGLWIELKRRLKGRLSDDQKKWLELMNGVGYQAVVANGCEEAIQVLENYLPH